MRVQLVPRNQLVFEICISHVIIWYNLLALSDALPYIHNKTEWRFKCVAHNQRPIAAPRSHLQVR